MSTVVFLYDRKKIILFLLLCLLLSNTFGQAAKEWYKSDQSGFLYKKIDQMTGQGYEASIYKSTINGGFINQLDLYNDSQLIETTKTTIGSNLKIKRVTKEKNKLLTEETLYTDSGLPQKEIIFLENGKVEETTYTYNGIKLIFKEKLSDGRVSRVNYYYSSDGDFLSLNTENAFYSGQSINNSFLSKQWSKSDGGTLLNTYDQNGHLIEAIFYKDSEIVYTKTMNWINGILASTLHIAKNKSTAEKYYTDGFAIGLLSEEEISMNKKVEEHIEYIYNKKKQLISSKKTKGLDTFLTEHDYEQEEKTQTRVFKNGFLITKTNYESSAVITEEIYEKGKLAAKLYFTDGKKTGEEIFKDDKIIRTGIYK